MLCSWFCAAKCFSRSSTACCTAILKWKTQHVSGQRSDFFGLNRWYAWLKSTLSQNTPSSLNGPLLPPNSTFYGPLGACIVVWKKIYRLSLWIGTLSMLQSVALASQEDPVARAWEGGGWESAKYYWRKAPGRRGENINTEARTPSSICVPTFPGLKITSTIQNNKEIPGFSSSWCRRQLPDAPAVMLEEQQYSNKFHKCIVYPENVLSSFLILSLFPAFSQLQEMLECLSELHYSIFRIWFQGCPCDATTSRWIIEDDANTSNKLLHIYLSFNYK